jgi:hypothetical protein
MSDDSRGNEPDVVNNGALAVILGIVALATLAIALVVTALVRDEVSGQSALRDVTQDRVFRDLRAAQLGKLESPAAWLDKGKGVVSLPIGRAMSLVLEEVRSNPEKLSPWFVSTQASAPSEAAPSAGTSSALPEETAPKTEASAKAGTTHRVATDEKATAPALPSALPTRASSAPPAATTPTPNPPSGKEDVRPLPP